MIHMYVHKVFWHDQQSRDALYWDYYKNIRYYYYIKYEVQKRSQ